METKEMVTEEELKALQNPAPGIIRVTNPQRRKAMGGESFSCAACGTKQPDWDAGVACAIADYKKRDGQ